MRRASYCRCSPRVVSCHHPGLYLYLSLFIMLLTPAAAASDGIWSLKALDPGRLYDVCFVDEWTGWVVGDSGKIYKTTDGGESWDPQPRVTFEPLYAVSFVDSNTGYAVGDMNTIIKTTDGGAAWNVLTTPDVALIWQEVHFADDQTGWIRNSPSLGDGAVRKTTDGGLTWSAVPALGTVWDMYFRDGTKGWFPRQDTISHTPDGTNWSDISVTSQRTLDQVAFPTDSVAYGLTLFDALAGFSYLSKSTDGGAVWDTLASFTTPVRDIAFPDASEGWAIGGSHAGGAIDHTTDGGLTWERELTIGAGNPLYGLVWKSHFVDKDNGWAVGFTFGITQQCLVARYQNLSTGVDDAPALASAYSLAQNYPNPFNPTTRIDYTLPTSGTVNLSVFNVLGQKVAELVNGFQDLGHNSVTFDASGFPSGVYTYRITVGPFTDIRKMLLLK